jgi:hypothetical protein
VIKTKGKHRNQTKGGKKKKQNKTNKQTNKQTNKNTRGMSDTEQTDS